MNPGASESRLWHILNLGREYLTHWAIAGAIIALTGFAPEHWVADLFSHLAVPESLQAGGMLRTFDFRLGLVAVGVAIIAWDVLRRSTIQKQGEETPHDSQIKKIHTVSTQSSSSDDQKSLQGNEAQTLALPDKPSIAVLPFQNMSGDPEQEYFADGMAEEILMALSYCKSLFVIARNSSFTYKGKAIDVRQVGRELGVRYVLEGSIRRSGDVLRFTGQLVDATTGAHIWADRFDGGTSDVFELQNRIAESVVAAIEPNVQLAEIERMKHKPVASFDAYDLLLRAQQLEYEFTEESVAGALRCLEQALVIDPNYAPAMAMASYCYAEARQQGWLKDPAKLTKEFGWPCARLSLPRTTPMYCGWPPMPHGSWRWTHNWQRTSYIVRCC